MCSLFSNVGQVHWHKSVHMYHGLLASTDSNNFAYACKLKISLQALACIKYTHVRLVHMQVPCEFL